MIRRLCDLRDGEIVEALDKAERLMNGDKSGNIHSVGWGEVETNKERTGNLGVIVTVKKKGKHELRVTSSPLVPRRICGVITDVQEQPEQEIRLLRWNTCYPEISNYNQLGYQGKHRDCYNTPIPGGVEIYPISEQWVGTLGCKVVYSRNGTLYHGAITNWHVATGNVGAMLGQPGNNNELFAKVAMSPGIDFSGSNYVDLSVLNTSRADGKYAPITHTVKAEQVTLGSYQSEISDSGIGTTVARDGRTLGRVTNGRVSQIGATVRVGYGGGKVATFKNQFIVTRQLGEFSAPGDSGSMVFEYPNMRPFGLLFAGGGGTTIVSPAEFVLELGNVVSFS